MDNDRFIDFVITPVEVVADPSMEIIPGTLHTIWDGLLETMMMMMSAGGGSAEYLLLGRMVCFTDIFVGKYLLKT